MSYLSPYLEALGSDFSNGANFAISGSATLPRDRPFALHVQAQQFLHFKQRSLELISRGTHAQHGSQAFVISLDSLHCNAVASKKRGKEAVVRAVHAVFKIQTRVFLPIMTNDRCSSATLVQVRAFQSTRKVSATRCT